MIILQGKKMRIAVFAALFLLVATGIFSQDEQRYIPEELLRPRRDEAPRYPIDTVIGPLGQGQASTEAYQFARNVASALLAGGLDAPILSTVDRVFLESCMDILDMVNPRVFRLGSGREEPDGSVSFLVRFVGREQGLTGEMYIRFEEQLPDPLPQVDAVETETEIDIEFTEEQIDDEQVPSLPPPVPAPAVIVPVRRVWVFEDLIMEEPRNREEENRGSRHLYDFPPYERFF
jgi:hypothetical protein